MSEATKEDPLEILRRVGDLRREADALEERAHRLFLDGSGQAWERLGVVLAGACEEVIEPPRVKGRPSLPQSDLVFCLTWWIYRGVPARQIGPDLEVWQQRRFIKSAPQHNTLMRCLGEEWCTPVLAALVARSWSAFSAADDALRSDTVRYSAAQGTMEASVYWRSGAICQVTSGACPTALEQAGVLSMDRGDANMHRSVASMLWHRARAAAPRLSGSLQRPPFQYMGLALRTEKPITQHNEIQCKALAYNLLLLSQVLGRLDEKGAPT